MRIDAVEEARQEIAALRGRIADCRHELGLPTGEVIQIRDRRPDQAHKESHGSTRLGRRARAS